MKLMLDTYKTLKMDTEYLKLILANIFNRFGDAIDAIALTWLVYEITKSPLWSTIIFGSNLIPTICIQPFTGAFVETKKKQSIMVIADYIRGFLMAGIAFLYLSNQLSAWILLVVTLLNSTVEAFRIPAGTSIVPKLLQKSNYEKGISLNSSLSRTMELFGTGCAGFIIAFFGIHGAILLDAMTFFISGLIISWIHIQEDITTSLSSSHYLQTLKEGFSYILNRNSLVLICIIGSLLNFLITPLNSLLPSYIDQTLHGGSQMLSILSIGISIGSILGSLFYPYISSKLSFKNQLLSTFIFTGLFFILIIICPTFISTPLLLIPFILLLFVILGLLSASCSTFLSVYFTSTVNEEYLARAGATFNAFLVIWIPIGSLIISLLLQIMSVSTILLGTGILSLICSFLFFQSKTLYTFDKHQ